MNQRLMRIAQRREVLVASAAVQRLALAHSLEEWQRPLALADRGLDIAQAARKHPAWLAAGVLLPGLLGFARVGTWFRRGFVAWQLLARVRGTGRFLGIKGL